MDPADRLELHELPGRYGDAIDDRAWDRLDDIFTTDAVFTEVLAALSAAGPYLRQEAVRLVEGLLDDAQVRVVEGTRALFLEGLALDRARPDKAIA